MWTEGIDHLKIPRTPPEIGVKTSRLAAQCLNTLHGSPPMRSGVRGHSSHGQEMITHVIVAACNEVVKSSEASIGIPVSKIRFKSSGTWSCILGRVFPAVSNDICAFIAGNTMIFRNVGKYELNDTASQPRRVESSVKLISESPSHIAGEKLTLRRLMSYIYIYIYMEHPFLMFLDHTQRRSTVGRTPLDE